MDPGQFIAESRCLEEGMLEALIKFQATQRQDQHPEHTDRGVLTAGSGLNVEVLTNCCVAVYRLTMDEDEELLQMVLGQQTLPQDLVRCLAHSSPTVTARSQRFIN